MRILLTGASSFVGRHLVPLIERAGHDVVRLVRTPRGAPQEVVWDCRNPLPALPPCDAVMHLAAHVDFQAALDLPLFQMNVVSTMRLAAFARRHSARFILASMAGVHGDAAAINTTTPIAPKSGYAMSKYLAEEAIRSSVDQCSILRIGGMYGLDGPTHLGVNAALSKAYHAGAAPVLRGKGTARRNYICVDDAARWMVTVLTRPDVLGETLYLAGSEVLTIAEYLETIANVLLPNVPVHRMDGAESTDCVITPSALPFPLTSFASYLAALPRA